jgi:AcrR family transcriptional regulator
MPKATAQLPTRERLLAAAVEGIADRGWGAVTTRQVAGIAGVNPALVHYHFGSMEVLRREAVLHALAAEIDRPMAALAEAPTLADGVEGCLVALEDFDPRSARGIVLYEGMLAAARDDELRSTLRGALAEFRALFAARLAADGAPDPSGAASVLAAALDGLLLHRLVDPTLPLIPLAPAMIASLQLPQEAP